MCEIFQIFFKILLVHVHDMYTENLCAPDMLSISRLLHIDHILFTNI
jgi:hypothetical protein